MSVGAIVPAAGTGEEEVLGLAAAAESASEHPVARAITERGRRRLGRLSNVEGFVNHAGLGVEAVVEGRSVVAGRPALVEDHGAALPAMLVARAEELEAAGATVVWVAADLRCCGLIALTDRVKPTSRQAVAELRALGLSPVLLSGDNERAAANVAAAVGIDRVLANVLPDGKAAEIRRLQSTGQVVAMVGDGVNDAPALAQADLGLSIGTGTDIAIEADAIRLARRTLATIKVNLWWAFAYNLVAVPLAVAGIIQPVVAAGAMAFSSVFVVTNSLRLRRFRPRREGP